MGVGWKRIGAPVTAVAAAVLSLGGVAHAMGEPETGAFNEFRLKGSQGYSIVVWGLSESGYRHGEVIIFATRGKQSVTYQAPAQVTDTRIDADLGALGEIDVIFQSNGKAAFAHPFCEPEVKQEYEPGAYVGKIEIRGEEGYTKVSAKRAAFTYHPVIDVLDCSKAGTGTQFGRDLPGAQLDATLRRAGGSVRLQVNQNRPGARVRMAAGIVERRGRVRVSREVGALTSGTALHFASDLSTASFNPPVLFSGNGIYRANATPANRWTGSLHVDFPGHSNVSLTGAKFRSRLRPAKLTKEIFYPERSRRPSLPPLP